MRPAQTPLGDHRRDERSTDPTAPERLAHHEVADPALEGGVVQPPPEAEDDEASRPAIGEREEGRGVHVVDQRLEGGPMRLGVGLGQRVQLAHQRERIGEVVPGDRADVHALGTRDRETADRTVRIA
jgi:hypothetical protein